MLDTLRFLCIVALGMFKYPWCSGQSSRIIYKWAIILFHLVLYSPECHTLSISFAGITVGQSTLAHSTSDMP